MPPMIDISLIGDQQLIEALDSLEAAVQRKLVRRALRTAMRLVRDTARQLVPVDTGRLKASIKIRAGKRSRTRISIIVRTGDRAELGISPDDPFFYPAVVEYGQNNQQNADAKRRQSRRRGRSGKVNVRKVPAKPYLRPALKTNQSRLLRMFADTLGKDIEAHAKNNLRRAA